MRLRAAEMAGELEDVLDAKPERPIVEEHGQEYFRHTSLVEYARQTLGELRTTPLEAVREGLRTARSSKRGT